MPPETSGEVPDIGPVRRPDYRPADPPFPRDPESPAATAAAVETRGVVQTKTPWWARLLIGLLVLLGLVFVAGRLVSLPDLNPFDSRTTDRSQPVLLQSVRDLSSYDAAQGTFQVVIDLEKDRKYVPDFLLGERTLFVAAGTVDASVDFSQLGKGAVKVTGDTSVSVTLPPPQLGRPQLDLDKSYAYAEKRGLIDRLADLVGSDTDRQASLYRLARDRIAAVADDADLTDRAEDNTRRMLTGLMRSLGYDDVTVTFDPSLDPR